MENLSEHKSGTSIEKYFSSDGLYKVISIGSYGLNNEYIDQGIRAVKNKTTESKLVRSGQLTMVLNDKTANGNLIGRCLLISTDNEFIVNQRTEIIIPGPDLNGNYAYYYLNGPFRSKVKRIAQGGTQIYVNYSSVKKQKINYPIKDEQIKISKLLKIIKKLITLYERKIKALKKLKQAIFEVLNSIPHKSNVYRISEIFDVTRGNVLSKKSISNKFSNMYPVYSSQTKNDGLLGYYSDYLFENSITWTTDGANAGTVKYRTGKFYCTNVCGVLLNSEGYCNEYTAEVIEKETPKFVSHVGNPKLMNNVMKQIKIKLPDVATQQSYSDILLTFDNVCTSFCNKLNDLNQIKNKLLNTMFI